MKKTLIAIAAVAAGLLSVGCGTSHQTGQAPINGGGSMPSSAPAAQPANPVAILKLAGAHVPAGVKLGDHDVFGDRMASGTLSPGQSGETATVYTATPDMMSGLVSTESKNIDDSTAMVTGHNFVVMVYAGTAWSASGDITYIWPVSPATVAQRVHGHVAH